MATGRRPAIGVLGGGALGLAAALRLAQSGSSVTLIEREPHLGGLAAGFRVGPSWLEKFYHHVFRTDTTMIRLVEEMGLGERLTWGRPNTSVFDDGRIYSLGSVGAVLRLPLLPPVDRLRLLAGMAVLKAVPHERVFERQRAVPWMRRLMGPRVYESFWEPMLRGKFGERADEIAMSWMWSRIHERTFRLGYIRGGFQHLYLALGDRIRTLGGQVLTGTAATAIRGEGGGVAVDTDQGGSFHFDQLLVTLPTALFYRLAQGLPDAFRARYPGPDHYGAHVLILALDRPLTGGVYWLNINDRSLPFLALVEHTSFLPAADYGGRHLVYLGNYLPMDHPLFRQSDAEVYASFVAALPRVRADFDTAWVREHWVFKAPFAQPIVTPDYLDRLPPHRTPLPGVFLANMAHVYPQDRGQNYSLRLGERMAGLMRAELGGPAGSDSGST